MTGEYEHGLSPMMKQLLTSGVGEQIRAKLEAMSPEELGRLDKGFTRPPRRPAVQYILKDLDSECGYDVDGVALIVWSHLVYVYEHVQAALPEYKSIRKNGPDPAAVLIGFVPEQAWDSMVEPLHALGCFVTDKRG